MNIKKDTTLGKYFIRERKIRIKNSIFAIVKHQEYLDVHQPSFEYCSHGGKMMRIVNNQK